MGERLLRDVPRAQTMRRLCEDERVLCSGSLEDTDVGGVPSTQSLSSRQFHRHMPTIPAPTLAATHKRLQAGNRLAHRRGRSDDEQLARPGRQTARAEGTCKTAQQAASTHTCPLLASIPHPTRLHQPSTAPARPIEKGRPLGSRREQLLLRLRKLERVQPAASGCSEWLQRVVAASGRSEWLQRVVAASGCSEWLQRVVAASGNTRVGTREWEHASGCSEWLQRVGTRAGPTRRKETGPVETGPVEMEMGHAVCAARGASSGLGTDMHEAGTWHRRGAWAWARP
jgi:hypothetical protein